MDFRTRIIEWFDRHTVDDVPLKSRNDPMITIKREHSFVSPPIVSTSHAKSA
jgi:hypothetical protein